MEHVLGGSLEGKQSRVEWNEFCVSGGTRATKFGFKVRSRRGSLHSEADVFAVFGEVRRTGQRGRGEEARRLRRTRI